MERDGETKNPLHTDLHRVLTLRHAVAIYVSSLLGSGIFVIPGLAARIAGPASIISWILLSLAPIRSRSSPPGTRSREESMPSRGKAWAGVRARRPPGFS